MLMSSCISQSIFGVNINPGLAGSQLLARENEWSAGSVDRVEGELGGQMMAIYPYVSIVRSVLFSLLSLVLTCCWKEVVCVVEGEAEESLAGSWFKLYATLGHATLKLA